MKYLCVINLAGAHKPYRVRERTGTGTGLWDASGNWQWEGGKQERGYREWLFDTKREADIWYMGARGVCDALKDFAK